MRMPFRVRNPWRCATHFAGHIEGHRIPSRIQSLRLVGGALRAGEMDSLDVGGRGGAVETRGEPSAAGYQYADDEAHERPADSDSNDATCGQGV